MKACGISTAADAIGGIIALLRKQMIAHAMVVLGMIRGMRGNVESCTQEIFKEPNLRLIYYVFLMASGARLTIHGNRRENGLSVPLTRSRGPVRR